MEAPIVSPATPAIAGSAALKRGKSDYLKFYHDQCRKLAPRTIDFDHHAYENTLALLMFDYQDKRESECVIALAKMGLYAPLTGPRG